ncbi:uncharacterized protein MKK02DRAFT_45835 [Dioszegia hungarica]|uniref:Uncharacterized protein n=1 Tax=Dioszegia hungarica TaxID=4972 RepID=A0AA38LVD9_9TREE|nr:uncharacterized protein MKK02DRAFT_45835 [Dioszegia hungarica]KAI9637125.1 hypothetical protein MKK02DRAFT_45835 [Dioszegia hungarica]
MHLTKQQTPSPGSEGQKRKSFLRRMSFSKSSNGSMSSFIDSPPLPTPPGQLRGPSKNRSFTAPIAFREPHPVGGVPYEQQQPARPARRVSGDAGAAKSLSRLEIRDVAPNTPAKLRPPIYPAMAAQRSHEMVPPRRIPSGSVQNGSPSIPISPQHQRPPVYPALASPPNSPPQPGTSSSPYGAAAPRQSTLPTPLQFGPPKLEIIASSQPPARPQRSSSHRAPPPLEARPSPFTRTSSNATVMPDPSVSEASAYALAHRGPTTRNPSSPPVVERRVSRPLPRPPSIIGKSASGADMHLLSSSSPSKSPSHPSIPIIDFPRSPTIPALIDPRHRSPALSPTSPSQSQVFRKAARRPRRLTLAYIVAQPRVQARLLPVLPVNSFLSLVGASPNIRKAFTGEAVGRWVTREWGIKVDSEKGRSWPNLTVWEGFLEALLHNPATYHTYPPKWHSLLQHLCLSYTLVVLHLRNLPATCFPDLPYDEELAEAPPPAAEPTIAGLSRMARHERLVELVMPSPLSSTPPADMVPDPSLHRRGSMASLSSAASFSFPRKRSNSLMPSNASIKPPPSYPQPKRYGFKSGDGQRSRTSSESGRPGSVFSYQSSPSIRPSVQHRQKNLLRASFASSDHGRTPSPKPVQPTRVEPIFDQPPPYTLGRAPVLRVFVPLSERVPRWPSAEGAMWTVKELDKCGATKRLRLGDLVVNTAIRPEGTGHILIFVPFVKHLLVPLEYAFNRLGQLPSYIDAFSLPPSYYHPLLSPIILSLDLAPFVSQAMSALRLAYDRRDVTVSSGARVTAKRYIHVTGFEVQPTQGIAPEWQGIVSLEAEGTVEGKAEIEKRLGHGDPRRAMKGPWEVVREKSMRGNVWLRLVVPAQGP